MGFKLPNPLLTLIPIIKGIGVPLVLSGMTPLELEQHLKPTLIDKEGKRHRPCCEGDGQDAHDDPREHEEDLVIHPVSKWTVLTTDQPPTKDEREENVNDHDGFL